jgi:hypothetical protein
MNKPLTLGLVIALGLVVFTVSCVPGPNDCQNTPGPKGRVAGFWMGLWQGLLAPITFIISIFTRSVNFYEVHNSGFWYNFGFVLGAGLFLSGGILGRKRKR